MKEYIYSASNNSFFKISEAYLYEGQDLADGVEAEESMFDEFTQDRLAVGLVRIAGNDGLPAWVRYRPQRIRNSYFQPKMKSKILSIEQTHI